MALRGTLTHRKTRRLAAALKIPPCYALGIVEAIWHVTAEQCPCGDIGRMSNRDIADEIFFEGDPDALISALVDARFVDRCDSNRLVIHHWQHHADQATKRKVGRMGSSIITETVKNTEKVIDCVAVSSQPLAITGPPEPVPVPEPVPEPVSPQPPEGRESKLKSKSNPKASIETAEVPKEIDTPEVRKSVTEWLEHRRQKRETATPITLQKLLKRWARAGPAAFVEAIEHSIANGWTGVFAPNQNQGGKNGQNQRRVARLEAPPGKYEKLPEFED